MSEVTYPNPEFDESKEQLAMAADPTQFPDRKWSYDGQNLDVWPVTPMAFPEHKDVWGHQGWATYSQGHLWWDGKNWNIFQWPSRPQNLSDKWYHPIQKVKKEEYLNDALKAVKQYVRDNCHAEPVIANRPMPADDAGQEMYFKHHMGLLTYEQMDRLRRQTAFDPQRDFTNEYTKKHKDGASFAYYVPTGEVVFSTGGSHNDLIYQLSKYLDKDLEEWEVYLNPDVKAGFVSTSGVDRMGSSKLTPEEMSHVVAAYKTWLNSELPEQDEEDYQNFFDRRWERNWGDKLAGYGDGPTPEKWQHLRDEIKDETDPTAHPNRKWSHTWGPNGYLDVWPVNEIAYPEHVDVWGSWGWDNCSQGHLWYDEDAGKWMIYPWKERPHCMNYNKPKEGEIKKQFIEDSTKAVMKYVKDVLHGEPEIATYPMPADSKGQTFYAEQYKTEDKNKYPRNTPEYDITRIFNEVRIGNEAIYWNSKAGEVWWYLEDANDIPGLQEVKEDLLDVPEVKNVNISIQRPAGPWKKLASQEADDLFDNLKVKVLDADEWENDKGHVPGMYSIDNNTLYLASGPGHHGDIMEKQGYMNLINSIAIDFKNPMNCVIIAPNVETPREYLEVLYRWITSYRPGCSVYVEFNGENENRLEYHKYMEQVYEHGAGWNPNYWEENEPYYEEYGHTIDDHNAEPIGIDWNAMATPATPAMADTWQHEKINILEKKINIITNKIEHLQKNKEQWDDFSGKGWSKQIDMWIDKRDKYQMELDKLLPKEGASEWYWWLYDLDTGQIAIAPKSFRSDDGLEGALDNPKRWLRGRYWSGNRPEIKIDSTHLVSSPGEMNQALTRAIRRLSEQEGVGQFFAAKGDSYDSVIPEEHKDIGWIIWYADERDEVEDKGLAPGHSIIFTDQQMAEKAFSNLKNVDLWQVDMTGNDVYEKGPNQLYTHEKFYPEQLHLLFGPSDPPQKNQKAKDSFRWSYSIATGELVVSPDNNLPEDHWSTLNYPRDWIGGSYEINSNNPLIIMEKPKNLSLDKLKEYQQDIMKKLQTLPFL